MTRSRKSTVPRISFHLPPFFFFLLFFLFFFFLVGLFSMNYMIPLSCFSYHRRRHLFTEGGNLSLKSEPIEFRNCIRTCDERVAVPPAAVLYASVRIRCLSSLLFWMIQAWLVLFCDTSLLCDWFAIRETDPLDPENGDTVVLPPFRRHTSF